MRTTVGLVVGLMLAVAAGCSAKGNSSGAGGSGGAGGGSGAGSSTSSTGTGVPNGTLTIKPNPIDVTVNGKDVDVPFTTTSSSDGDVTTKAAYTADDPTLISVVNGKVHASGTLDHGGPTVLHATYGLAGNQVGDANVVVKVHGIDIVDPSSPTNPSTYFGQQGGSPPSWVYPFDRTMLPKNQPELTFQIQGVGTAQVYRLRLEGQYFSRDIYFGAGKCAGSNCSIQLADADWQALTKAFAGQDVKATVSASQGPNGPAADGTPITISFSPDDVLGGVYYWSTTITGIYRVPLGAKQATTFVKTGNEFGCAGCHAVSRDGKKVAMEFGSADGVGGGVVDGANGQTYLIKPPSAGQWNLQSFSPDGKMLIVNWMQHCKIIDSSTGAMLYDVPTGTVGGNIAQPEWSPDGKSIVFVRYPSDGSGDEWNANNNGDIMIMPFNNGNFGAPTMIVQSTPGKEYHFYPSWTPDSKWIVFNTGTVPCGGFGGGGCNNYDASNTRLRLVAAMGGSQPIDLTRATHAMNQTTNWPRVAPFIQKNGSLVFFTFSSKFPYGFIGGGGNPQLWMAAIDLSKAAADPNSDPSYAPYWLTFQNLMESNHLATWTESVQCHNDSDCPGLFRCQMGQCVPDDIPK